MKMIFFLPLFAILASCASAPTPIGNSQASNNVTEMAAPREPSGQVCIFEIDPEKAKKLKIYYRKTHDFSSNEADKVAKMKAFYVKLVEYYMRTEREYKGPLNMKMFEDFVSGDGAYIQRIIWGKGSNRRSFVDVSHYPGDNHYGAIYEIVSGKPPQKVLKIEDGDFEACQVTISQ